jgi:hypothetical protein
MSTHVYKALEGFNYIRLIVLHPASSDDAPLKISFQSSTLEDFEGRYDAISYTWGEPILSFALHVDDGTQVCVTRNLDKALRYLRYNERERSLWADAACINQNDNDEKAIQIPLMVQIFRGARKVMAWLDPGGDTTVEQKGMRLLDRLSRLSKTKAGKSYDDLSTVLKFLNLPWFNRLWIVQEVVFNLEVCLICGKTELPFSRLVSALSVIKPRGLGCEPSYMAELEAIVEIGGLWNLYSLFREKVTQKERHIMDETRIIGLLKKFVLYECTDPRDRIFALCSMANDVKPTGNPGGTDGTHLEDLSNNTEDDRIRIDIDYSLGIKETYEAFALAYLTQANTANLIWEALFKRQYSSLPMDWPSWVPDWRVLPREMERWYRPFGGNFRKIATGILRVGFPITRSILEGKGKQLYTVNYKISKETKGPQMSFDFQLLQLYQMLKIPETTQGPHQLPIQSASTPRKPNLINFPNLLVRMITEYVGYDDYGNCRNDYSDLGRYLARMSMEPDLQRSSEPSSDYVKPLVEGLAQSLGNSSTLFSFHDPGTGVNSVGYGNVALELGDSLLPMESTFVMPDGSNRLRVKDVFILRPIYTMEVSDGEKQVYRLVGNARIFDPTIVLLWVEDKRLWDTGQVDTYLPTRETMRKEEEREKALLSSFGIHEFEQVVYLA